jgi:hypothetical protein
MYIHTEIKTYRHTQTNRQTDSAEVQEGRQKNIQMYRKTIAYLKTDRQTDRQTDRKTEQTSTEHTSTERQRDRQTDRRQYICAVQKYSDRNLKIKKVSNRLRLRIFFL